MRWAIPNLVTVSPLPTDTISLRKIHQESAPRPYVNLSKRGNKLDNVNTVQIRQVKVNKLDKFIRSHAAGHVKR